MEPSAENEISRDRPSLRRARGRGRLLLFGAGAILYVTSILNSGYFVYYNNHANQLPLVYALQDSSLFVGDPFVEAMKHHPSLLWRALGLLPESAPLEGLLFVLFLVERALLLAAGASLARSMAPRAGPVGGITAMAFLSLFPHPFFGSGTMSADYLEQSGLAVPFLLFAIALLLRGRLIASAVLLAAGFSLNSLYGVFAAGYVGALILAEPKLRHRSRELLAAAGVFVVLSLPAMWLTLATRRLPEVDPELWRSLGDVLFSYHLLPSTIEPAAYAGFFAYVGAIIWLVARRGRPSRFLLQVSAIMAVQALWLAFAITAELTGSVSLLAIQGLRGPDLGMLAITCGWLGMLGARLRTDDPKSKAVAYALLIGTLAVWAPQGTRFLVLGLGAIWLLASAWNKSRALEQQVKPRPALSICAIAALANLATFTPRAASDRGLVASVYARPSDLLFDCAEWIERNTPTEATVLLHPMENAMRAILKRPIFVTWSDAGSIFWSPAFAEIYIERMGALGLDFTGPKLALEEIPDHLNQLYAGMSDEDVRRLARRYGLTHWIVPAGRATAFPEVYRNAGLKVLDLVE